MKCGHIQDKATDLSKRSSWSCAEAAQNRAELDASTRQRKRFSPYLCQNPIMLKLFRQTACKDTRLWDHCGRHEQLPSYFCGIRSTLPSPMVGWTGWLLGGLAGWLAGKGYEIGFVNCADRSRCIVRTAEEVWRARNKVIGSLGFLDIFVIVCPEYPPADKMRASTYILLLSIQRFASVFESFWPHCASKRRKLQNNNTSCPEGSQGRRCKKNTTRNKASPSKPVPRVGNVRTHKENVKERWVQYVIKAH